MLSSGTTYVRIKGVNSWRSVPLTRACRGVIFQTLKTVQYYMAKAETTTGLKVKVSILNKIYKTGRKYAVGFKKSMKIVFDKVLPKWNYRAVPKPV